jgi:diguanylate cyclase (GGDEF)-like protein/PAS domain S-box-containing protein
MDDTVQDNTPADGPGEHRGSPPNGSPAGSSRGAVRAAGARSVTDRVREWVRDPGVLLPAAMTAYAIVYVAWLGSAPAASVVRQVILLLAFLPMNLGIVALSWRAARRIPAENHAGLRRALELTGVGFLGVLAGNICEFVYVHGWHRDPNDTLLGLPYLILYPCWLIALLALPRARRVRSEQRKFLYDAATILLGVGIAVWYLVVVPTALTGSQSLIARFFNVAYPTGDAAVALGLVTVILRRLPGPRRVPFGMLLLGITVYTASDLASDVVIQNVGYGGIKWTDMTFMAAYLLMAWACQRYATDPPPPGERERPSAAGGARVQPFTLLPYVAVVLCYGLLVAEAFKRPGERWAFLAIGCVAITCLVVLRQLAAVRENARLVSETAARENEARFRALVQHSTDVIAIADAEGVLRYVSPSIQRLFGYQPSDLEGKLLVDFLHPDDAVQVAAAFTAATDPGSVTAAAEWRIRHCDGRWLAIEAVGTNLLHEPTVRGIVVNARDVSDRKALEAQLTHQAFHDPLTGLANRALFFDRVTHALERRERVREGLAVLFLDLDNFKTVNDSLGHAAGDRLLVAAAVRLGVCVRASDTVARLGGDEFAVLIEDATGDLASVAAERITAALRAPFELEGKEVFVTASLGIAFAEPGSTASELLRNADMAMYTAKGRGKGRSERFETRMHREALDRLELEADLRRALERDEMTLLYQPIVSLDTGGVIGMEALVRWRHLDRGLMYPGQFIPLAEETGLIVGIGEWILREACRRAKAWETKWQPEVPLSLTVNISGQQLQHAGVVDVVRRALARSGLRPHDLVLEITESVLMQHTETMLHRLTELKAVGVRLAIDDFGTGYSSLSYLQRFPIDILKIAKPFVDDVGTGEGHPALARAIIALGESLSLRTIAEGIELREQWMGLRALGCEMGQGYFFARPLTAEAMGQVIADHARVLPVAKGAARRQVVAGR